jgi:E3 ubiquitin-protein ligase TRIP12
LWSYVQVELVGSVQLPDIPVLAARAITHIAEIMPSAGPTIIRYKGIAAFVERMRNSLFIDFAEQALQVRGYIELRLHEHVGA